MLEHKFHLIAWLELDSNLFEFNRFEFEFEKEKGMLNREAVQPRQPGLPLFFPLGQPFLARAHSLFLSFFSRSPRSPAHLLHPQLSSPAFPLLGPSTPEAQLARAYLLPRPASARPVLRSVSLAVTLSPPVSFFPFLSASPAQRCRRVSRATRA
jgi:hypothetical protein